MATRYQYRSFFWPGILIVVGVLALLVNSGLVPAERLDRLVDLWPLILVVIGLELLVRRALQGPAAEVAAALIVVLAIAGAAAYVALGSTATGTQTLDASGKVGNLDHAGVQVDAGAANITMQGSSTLGSDLYRAHIEYTGRKPDVSLDGSSGDLQISQGSGSSFFFQSHRFVLNLQLNSRVRWKITVDSGDATDTLNLSSVHVTGIELNTGAGREDITLGAPSGGRQATTAAPRIAIRSRSAAAPRTSQWTRPRRRTRDFPKRIRAFGRGRPLWPSAATMFRQPALSEGLVLRRRAWSPARGREPRPPAAPAQVPPPARRPRAARPGRRPCARSRRPRAQAGRRALCARRRLARRTVPRRDGPRRRRGVPRASVHAQPGSPRQPGTVRSRAGTRWPRRAAPAPRSPLMGASRPGGRGSWTAGRDRPATGMPGPAPRAGRLPTLAPSEPGRERR